MKKLLLTLITCTSTIISFAQGQKETSFYVYRNDGEFNAFFYSEIDSITFSTLDLDSVEQTTIVTQEFWTIDSVYRIPLSVLDSIGFSTPQTIINSNVFPLTAEHVPYIVRGDTLNFVMLSSTPKNMLPQKGNIVAANADCSSFANGIIARIISIDKNGEGYLYKCEKASLDDIYDQIVFYGNAVGVNQEQVDSSVYSPRRVTAEVTGKLWNVSFNKTWTYCGTTTNVTASDRAYCRLTLRKTLGQPLFAKISVNNDINSNISFNAKSEANIIPQPVQIGPTVRAGRITFPNPLLQFIWIEPQIRMYGYFEELGSVELDFSAHFNRHDEAALVYSDGRWNIDYTANNDLGVDIATLSMKGSAEVGLMPEILLALNGSPTGIGVNSRLGVKQTADFKFDAFNYFESGAYDALKDTKTETYQTQSASIFAQAGLFKEESRRGELDLMRTEKLISTHYLLPTFEEDFQKSDMTTNEIHIDVERKPILPVYLDMAIYDENDNIVQRSNDNDLYDGKFHSYYYTFTNLSREEKYKAYPLFKIGNIEMRATPAIEIDYCPASITKVECTDARYITDDDNASYPNRLYFDVTACLDDTDGIDEWGIYSITNNGGYKTFPFDDISRTQTISMRHCNDGSTMTIDYSSFVAEHDGQKGVYVKKTDSKTGKQRTILGGLYDYTLRYDTKPSITMSNPQIKSTEIIGSKTMTDDEGNMEIVNQYQTICNMELKIEGSFWMENVTYGISGGNWEWTGDGWRPTNDYTYSMHSIKPTYWDNSKDLNFSCWYIIHIRNTSQTVNSNYLNWSGNKTITNVWTSLSPSYAPRRVGTIENMDGKLLNCIEELSIKEVNKHKERPAKRVVPYKGGFTSVY